MQMWNRYRWSLWAVLAMLLGLGGTAYAQVRAPRETQLCGIAVGSSFFDVLTKKGTPDYIGPSVGDVTALRDILDPLPEMEQVAPTMASGPTPDGTVPPPQPVIKPWEKFTVWMYLGNKMKPDTSWRYFVIFNKQGNVSGVVATVLNPRDTAPIATASNITFGTSMFNLLKTYDYPDPFARIGTSYFCSYASDRNVTFTIDVATRRVVTIAVGMAVTVVQVASTDANAPGGAGMPGGGMVGPGGPGTLPGGGMQYPR